MENINDFSLPLHISNENRYIDCFSAKVDFYIQKFSELESFQELNKYKNKIHESIESMKKSKTEITKCFNLYLAGKEREANEIISCILGENSSALYFDLIDSNAFAGNILYRGNATIDNLYLFRGRKCNSYQTFEAKEMQHIPLNMRSKVDTYRYSILGVPCLYLAANSYTVWKELKCPSLDQLSISYIKMGDELLHSKIIDLSLPIESYYDIFTDKKTCIEKNDEAFQKIIECFKAVPIIISCSMVCDTNSERKFIVEYVMPQFLMRFVSDNVIGIAYRSNRIDGNESCFACNLAIPIIDFKAGKKYGNVIEKMSISDSLNIGYFKDFLERNSSLTLINNKAKGPSAKKMNKSFSLRISDAESTFNIVNRNNRFSFDGSIIYQDSTFYKFDEYILFRNEAKYLKNEDI